MRVLAVFSIAILLAFFSLVSTKPAFADGRNGGATEGSVSVSLVHVAICSYKSCIVDGEEIQPTSVSQENGVSYVY